MSPSHPILRPIAFACTRGLRRALGHVLMPRPETGTLRRRSAVTLTVSAFAIGLLGLSDPMPVCGATGCGWYEDDVVYAECPEEEEQEEICEDHAGKCGINEKGCHRKGEGHVVWCLYEPS